MSEVDDTCSVSAVVPTASTHHDRSPNIISHAYPSAPTMPSMLPTTASSTPSCRNSRRTLRRAEPDRPQQTDLAHALLDAQLEEQHHQQQRGDDDEEAEVDEVLAKVRGAARGLEALGAHVDHGEPERKWIGGRAKALQRRRRVPRPATALRRA